MADSYIGMPEDGYGKRTRTVTATVNSLSVHQQIVTQADNSGNLIPTSGDIDLVFNPSTAWTITRSDGQPDDETITLSDGRVFKRTFTYNSNGIMTARSAWVLQ